ncbi:response regulator transcription factor [Desulfoscipio gibsoniae]|uniref:Stage 0 sporulation protein A homolog n=1 Tax=Desulfoscipio gibsoniae DSM 7213 TaxID=767817 RepID=R4KRL6_9FIRM|nr:response regulator transcription factor [Desulfoscipio gibsoniae]AGL02251.1 response regulator with CheY-like receiver domain and winged-helix DNA-binding domain [Desulfoscipio gibsoniae DSM 7213]
MAGEKILVVDDEAVVRKLASHHLVKNGFQVITAEDGYKVFDLLRTHRPNLIILDILMPGLDGIEVCREVRKESDVPIIFLTSKNDSSDIVLGLGVGGDDYIIKPFNPNEMIARVRANLRRHFLPSSNCEPPEKSQLLHFPGLEIDLNNRTVLVDGSPITLTNKEFELLVLLAQNPNRIFKYDHLLELVWKFNDNTDNRTLMVHINRLRKKIEQNPSQPRYIITVRGIGYKLHNSKEK